MKSLTRVSLPAIFSFILSLPCSSSGEPIPHHSHIVESNAGSGECMSCHNGSVGKPVPVCTVKCGFNGPHIIDTPYPVFDFGAPYRPEEEILAMGIKLIGGNITCISCHNLHNPARYHLVMSNRNSRLCFACHLK